MTEQPSTSVQRIEPAYAAAMPAPQGGALPTGLEWQALERMAVTLAESSLIPSRLRNKPGDVAVILLAAREYGIPPLMAMSKLPVINGQPAPMGELMQALILRAGHRMTARFHEPNGELYAGGPITPQHYGEAVYSRRDWDDKETLRFTIAEALSAELITRITDGKPVSRDSNGKPQPWELYTPNMARWRAVANAARMTFADVLLGLSYLPEELGAIVDADGAPIEGEVIRAAAPSGTLEQRTAQEDADKLAEQPWPDHVVDAVRRKATEGGYVDVEVTYAGDRMTLEEALTRHVEDRKHADTVDAEIVPDEDVTVEDPPATEPEAAPVVEEPSEAPSTPEQTEPEAQAPPAEETPQEGALDLAREVLICRDVELLRSYYRGAMEDGLAVLDVLAVVDDSDLAVLGAPSDVRELALGTLIVRAADYVGSAGIAVRDPLPNFDEAPAPTVEDPWAADAAAGWPTSGDTPTT